MSVVNFTTPDGQQILLSTPVLSSGGSEILFAPSSDAQGKTIVLHPDGQADLATASGVEYTIIEDPSGSGGGFLQLNQPVQQASSENIVFSQEELYNVLSGVTSLQQDFVQDTASPAIGIKSKKPQIKLEKPIGKGPYSCQLCHSLEPFVSWARYKKHVKSHESDKRHRCPQCSMSYNVEKNLRLHIAAHNVDDLVCPECKKSFSRVASFKSHLTIHEEEDDLVCNQCEALFNTEAALNAHLENDHVEAGAEDTKEGLLAQIKGEPEPQSEAGLPPPEIEYVLKFTCKICQAKLKTLKQYNDHMEHHNKLKTSLKLKQKKRKSKNTILQGKYNKNACKTCGKKFQKPSLLLRHERIHSGAKPFVVSYSKKYFKFWID